MAKAPSIESIKREDFRDLPKELSDFLDRLLRPLNLFIATVYDALNGNLTFEENVTAMVKEVSIKAGLNPDDNGVTFSHSLKKKPTGLLLLQATQIADNYIPITAAISLSWRTGVGEIIVDAVTGLTNGETYILKLLVI